MVFLKRFGRNVKRPAALTAIGSQMESFEELCDELLRKMSKNSKKPLENVLQCNVATNIPLRMHLKSYPIRNP